MTGGADILMFCCRQDHFRCKGVEKLVAGAEYIPHEEVAAEVLMDDCNEDVTEVSPPLCVWYVHKRQGPSRLSIGSGDCSPRGHKETRSGSLIATGVIHKPLP